MAVLMKGFAIKKVLKNGKVTNENGFLGEYDGDIAKIVEMNNGKAKYTELNKRDIEKIISMQGHQESLEERLLANIKSRLPRHHRKYVHHQLHPYHTRKKHRRKYTKKHRRNRKNSKSRRKTTRKYHKKTRRRN